MQKSHSPLTSKNKFSPAFPANNRNQSISKFEPATVTEFEDNTAPKSRPTPPNVSKSTYNQFSQIIDKHLQSKAATEPSNAPQDRKTGQSKSPAPAITASTPKMLPSVATTGRRSPTYGCNNDDIMNLTAPNFLTSISKKTTPINNGLRKRSSMNLEEAQSSNANNSQNQNLQSRYEKLMNFSYNKQLDEIKDNLQRIEKH